MDREECGTYIQWNIILFKGTKQCQFHTEVVIQNEVKSERARQIAYNISYMWNLENW